MVTGDQSTHTGMYIRNDAGNKLRYCVLEDGNVLELSKIQLQMYLLAHGIMLSTQ